MEIAGISPDPAVMTDERGNVIVFTRDRRRLDGADGARVGGRVRRHGVVDRVPRSPWRRRKDGAVVDHAVSARDAARPRGARGRARPRRGARREVAARRADRRQGGRRRAPDHGRLRPRARRRSKGSATTRGASLRLEIQNENLVALEGGGRARSVPDIITRARHRGRRGDLDGAPAVRAARHRHRVPVRPDLADGAWARARRARAHFGYDLDYVPIEELHARDLTSGSASTSAGRTPTPSSSTPTTGCSRRRRSRRRPTSPAGSTRRSTRVLVGDGRRASASRTRCSARRTRPTPSSSDAACGASRVLRLGGPATHAIRPLFGWPGDLRDVVSAGETDRRRRDRVRRPRARRRSTRTRSRGSRASSRAGPTRWRSRACSRRSPIGTSGGRGGRRARCSATLPISLSAEIGSVGLLERENATVLNAALIDVARAVAGAIREALERARSDARSRSSRRTTAR